MSSKSKCIYYIAGEGAEEERVHRFFFARSTRIREYIASPRERKEKKKNNDSSVDPVQTIVMGIFR